MNIRAAQRYTESVANVGTTPVEVSLADFGGPPISGVVLSITVERTGGPGTLATTSIREGAAGPIRFQSTNDVLPGPTTVFADPQPRYEVSTPSDLKVEISANDGTNLTAVDVTVELRGPE